MYSVERVNSQCREDKQLIERGVYTLSTTMRFLCPQTFRAKHGLATSCTEYKDLI